MGTIFTKKALDYALLNPVLQQIHSHDIIGKQRLLFFRWFTVFIFLTAVAVTIDVNLTTMPPMGGTFPVVALFIMANYFLLGIHRNIKFAYAILISTVFFEIHLDSYFSGGVSDSGTFLYMVTLIGAFMLLGTRTGIVFLFLTIINQCYFYYIGGHTDWVTDYLTPAGTSARKLDCLILGSIAFVGVAGMLISFDRTKNKVLNILNQSRIELKQTNKELKESEQKLRDYLNQSKASNEELTQKNQDLDRFAYIVSHDLKAPLRHISSMAKFIEEDAADKLSRETLNYVEIIRSRISKMDKLISDILAYSKATRADKFLTEFVFNNLVQDTIDLIQLPDNCRIEVLGGERVVISDRTRMEQILLNLMVNAVNHHHNKRMIEIVISVTEEDKNLHFAIKDNGPGIAPEHFERIFQIFQTLSNNKDSENSGLGLAIVKRAVEDLNGKIWVESAPGKGTSFHFTLPKENIVKTGTGINVVNS